MLGYKGPVPAHHLLNGAERAARNARALVGSALAEFGRGRTSLADYLCKAANEESGKSVILLEAHVLSGSPRWDQARWKAFWEEFRGHEAKYKAAWATTMRTDGVPDRRPLLGHSQPQPTPAGRGHLFKKQKVPFLDMKEACLYVDYNPGPDGGRFISPLDLDADSEWGELWEESIHLTAATVAKRRLFAVEHLGEADVAEAALKARAAFDAGVEEAVLARGADVLSACGRMFGVNYP